MEYRYVVVQPFGGHEVGTMLCAEQVPVGNEAHVVRVAADETPAQGS